MAAIQLVQLMGGEIFATAGNPEKRAFLQSLGIQHIMDSRSLEFVEEVKARTNNCGVDLILNSLSGEALSRSFALLGPYGRFLEIGKRDIFQGSQLELKPFQKSLSFFAIALDQLSHDRPNLLKQLFHEIMYLFTEGKLKPLPYTAFPIEQATDAFRYMVQARHIGKIILCLRSEKVLIEAAPHATTLFDPDATYLITGGLGGLGLTIGNWMVQRGARHLALLSRRAASPEGQAAITALQQQGACIQVVQADITREEQVVTALQKISRERPPLRGILHAAALLDDGMLLHQERSRMLAVMAPKILGSWYLHKHTQHLPLDFFVLFSSIAGLLGSPGQSNYCAGNTFLDTLAHLRRTQGLPALSINWGPWAEVGLAANQTNRGQRLSYRGLEAMPPEQGLAALELLLQQDVTQAAVTPFDLQKWCQFYPTAEKAALFAHLTRVRINSSAQGEGLKIRSTRETLLETTPEKRLQVIKTSLGEKVARILGFKQTALDLQLPLNRLGIDSLMAVELRNTVEIDFGVLIPTVEFLKGDNVNQLAQTILDRYIASDRLSPLPPSVVPVPSLSTEISQFSNQEVDVLLHELLAMSDVDEESINQISLSRNNHE